MRLNIPLLGICAAALALRLFALTFVQHPGIADPNHYYNLGLRLVQGQGFTIDYIWNYFRPPEAIVHPEDHWMPLAGVLAAAGFSVLGENVPAALAAFVLIGALLPLIGYGAARQFGLQEPTALFCAAAVGALPEFILNSVRTDTTVPNVLLVCASILLLTHGLRQGRAWAFAASGVCAGLSYLTRNDGALLLPMLAVTALVYGLWGKVERKAAWWMLLLLPVTMLLVVIPWLLRNVQAFGTPSPSGFSDMFFYTDVLDHWSYGRQFTLETMLLNQTPAQLIAKRLFELAAAAKLMYTTLDMALPVVTLGGLLLLLTARDRQRWLILAPTLILLLGVLVAYPILIPYKSQSGSFKKAYLTLIPLLLPLAGYALERAITERRLRIGAMVLIVGFLAANGIELVRADARFTNTYLATMRRVADVVHRLPDTNGDGQVILMAQDQFMLRFLDVRSIMLPAENRETILAVAQRYQADYLMMPPDRPALDPLYTGQESDPRFMSVQPVYGTNVVIYGFDYEAASP